MESDESRVTHVGSENRSDSTLDTSYIPIIRGLMNQLSWPGTIKSAIS